MRGRKLALAAMLSAIAPFGSVANASHGVCTLSDGGMSNPQTGFVSAGQSHWYGFSSTGYVTISLISLGGDADLYVYRITGSSPCLYGSSVGGMTSIDSVSISPGSYNIEVRYYSGAAGGVEYVLRAT